MLPLLLLVPGQQCRPDPPFPMDLPLGREPCYYRKTVCAVGSTCSGSASPSSGGQTGVPSTAKQQLPAPGKPLHSGPVRPPSNPDRGLRKSGARNNNACTFYPPHPSRSRFLNWIASARCSVRILSLPARSAMVRLIFRIWS